MKCLLSIDGGGIRGIIPAMVLQRIETLSGIPISTGFDLIGGTSTGGILALGLSKAQPSGLPQYSAHDLLNLYLNFGSAIYNKAMRMQLSSIYGLLDELYSHQTLEHVLQNFFGKACLHDCSVPTMIACYDLAARKPYIIKSWQERYQDILMCEAARATSAAPTYFEPTQIQINSNERKALIDGGVCLNSPAASVYAEALRLFPDEHDFFMVSLGTGQAHHAIALNEAQHWGKLQWLTPLLNTMLSSMQDVVDYQMRQFLGQNYLRLQINVDNDHLDDASAENIQVLYDAGERLIHEHADTLHDLATKLKSNLQQRSH